MIFHLLQPVYKFYVNLLYIFGLVFCILLVKAQMSQRCFVVIA